MLINALQGRESSSIKSTAKQLTPEQRAAKLSSLRSQRQSWRDSTTEYRTSQKSQHLKLLQEGMFALHGDLFCMILLYLSELLLKIIFINQLKYLQLFCIYYCHFCH